ncbi:MAG: SDR family oxidoreductase [Anaerolinea sp.]|nr:SDR family oxidoreductase [Anaerolinea sp.]
MPQDLNGKVILVTGGAQGIGAAAARLCIERGASVYIGDVNAERGDALAREIGATFLPFDVCDEAAVKSALASVRTHSGRLDGIVCAAGIFRGAFQSPEELSLDDFQTVQRVNVTGVFLTVKHSLPLLRDGGVVVIIASGAGVQGPSSSLAYGASKGGANGLSMTLAAQLEKRGIRVNTLSPGSIVTDMKLSVELENARRQGIPAETAIARARQEYGTPDGVARIIAFILSDDADYVRGTIYTR